MSNVMHKDKIEHFYGKFTPNIKFLDKSITCKIVKLHEITDTYQNTLI